MSEAFLIAFIHRAGRSCVISYPRPDQAHVSYDECKAQLPSAPAGNGFDRECFQGAEIACIEVPVRAGADEWVALETSNVRKAPSAASDIIATVKRGMSLRILAQERKWLAVQMADGTLGFLWSDRAKRIHSIAPESSGANAGAPPKEGSPRQPPQEREAHETRAAATRN